MNYFKILGILFGLAAMLKPVYMHLLPWDENKFLAKTYARKRPVWIIPVAVFGLLLVAFTWYIELSTDVAYSMVITIIFSLTAIKALLFLFDYQRFQNWLQQKLKEDSGKKIVFVDIWAGALGLIVVVTSIAIFLIAELKAMNNSFTTRKFPAVRRASVDLLNAASRKNMIHAFAETDITEVRDAIRNLRRSRKRYLSHIGYIQFCVARAVEQQKKIQAYRDFRNRLVIFHDVDISTIVERKIGGTNEVLPTIIRSANRKSMFEISEEIKEAKEKEIDGSEVYKSIKTYLAIPAFIRRFAFRVLDRSPKLMKKKAGTIMVTSANACSSGMLWGVPVASHTLNITFGGITKNPVKKGESIEEREFLCLTVSVDHDIIDGAQQRDSSDGFCE